MPETVIPTDLFVNGRIRATSMTVPTSTITDASVQSGAAIDAAKLQHQHRAPYNQPNTTATAETRVIYRCYGTTATLLAFHAGSIVANAGAATITVDLRKNGTTVLSGVITLDNTNTARVAEAGSVSVTALVAGDVLEVVTTATAGGGTIGTGLFAFATINEMPS